ncbi:MAG: class I SAM-dependent methyltransferase [Candidatus Coatesbacteria bacterium]
MDQLYDHPKYYEIAFSFRDIPREVDVFEACFQRFSRIPVKSVLEVACGNAPHLEELAKRGYRYTGLDLNEAMLAYSGEKAKRIGADARFIRADMAGFRIEPPVDFAYVMLGSLQVPDTAALMGHFDSMAASVKPGGLYFLDWCISTGSGEPGGETWEVEQEGIRIKVSYIPEAVDPIAQTSRGLDTLEVDDHGRRFTLQDVSVKRDIYPQEFLLLLKARGDFEFVGWWNNWDLDQPLSGSQKIARPITVIRRV